MLKLKLDYGFNVHTFPRCFKRSARALGERKNRKFSRGCEQTILHKVRLDWAFNDLRMPKT